MVESRTSEHSAKCPHGKRLWERCIACQFGWLLRIFS